MEVVQKTQAIPSSLTSDEEIFTESWWAEFKSKTHQLKQTTIIENVIPKADCERIRNFLLAIIYQVISTRKPEFFRFWIDGDIKHFDFVESFFNQHAPLPGDTFNEWTTRTFEGNIFGMILNNFEGINEAFARKVGTYLDGLKTDIGVPINGFVTDLFMGNYGFTPIGIHQDEIGGSVLHLHFGPGKKIMYTWSPDLYHELNDAYDKEEHGNYMEYMIPHGDKHLFREGDVYFMPDGLYHVGYQDEIAMALTIWFENMTARKTIEKLIDRLKYNYVPKVENPLPQGERNIQTFDQFDHIANFFRFDGTEQELNILPFFKELYKDHILSLYSNNGLLAKPKYEARINEKSKEELEKLAHQVIWLKHPFKLYDRLALNRTERYVYCRAYRLVVPDQPFIRAFVAALNRWEKINVQAWLVAYPGISKEILLKFVAGLYNRNGLFLETVE